MTLAGLSLRARLLLAVLLLVTLGLTVAGAATYAAFRSFLLHRVDEQFGVTAVAVADQFRHGEDLTDGEMTAYPHGTLAELRDAGGGRVDRLRVMSGRAAAPPPVDLPDGLDVAQGEQRRVTVPGWDGGPDYRVAALGQPGGGSLLVGVPLDAVAATLDRLVLIEVLVAAGVLLALALAARWAIAVGLRPLSVIEATAGAVAGGDLARRVPTGPPGTEIGRLATALNGMLGQIEAAFRERAASEARLRRFVADASHELRTPLTSIRGYAELFRRGASERPEDLAKVLRRVEEEADRMGLLVDDLLLLARLDEGRPLDRVEVDLAEVAADAVEGARAADPDRPFDLVTDGTVLVVGDRARLHQVVANLLSNARTHTPPGTPVRVGVRADGGGARLPVADRGPGLDPEHAAHAFERFYRADTSRARDSGGTGLGLSIVAAIVRAHDGDVAVTTTPGGGATFTLELPLRAGVPATVHS